LTNASLIRGVAGGIIDAHAHCSNRTDDALVPYARMNGLQYNLDELLSRMKKNGVGRALLLSPPLESGGPLPNEDVLALCRKSGGKLSPMLTVEPTGASVTASLRLAKAESKKVKGFKIRLGYVRVYADDEVFDPLYDYAEEQALPVLFHAGDTATSSGSLEHAHPLTLDRLANKREGLRMVICHMGNPWMMDTAEMVYKHPNVYADISGLVTGHTPYVEKYMESLSARISEVVYFAGGADKILFGTDYPVQTHEVSLGLVELLEIENKDKEKILRINAERLFSL